MRSPDPKSFPAAGANPRRCLYYFLGHVELLNFYGPLKSSATTHTSPCDADLPPVEPKGRR